MARRSKADIAGGLTDRELQVLHLSSRGFTVPESAKQIGIAKLTAAMYMQRVLKKLDACTQAEAVYRALKEGIIR